jgi:secondary thiamine-phosphate synthase enzyme
MKPMAISTASFRVSTKKEGDIIDITGAVSEALLASGTDDGLACVMVRHSTAAVFIMEDEAGLRDDLRALLERAAPKDMEYRHNASAGDGNGHSHLRAALLGMSVTVPVVDRKLALGRWQRVLVMELDDHGRERDVIVQVIG